MESLQQPRFQPRPLQSRPLGPGEPDREAERSVHTVFVRAEGVCGTERRGDGIGAYCGDGGEEVRV